jgi:hypothetical protein
MIEFLTSDPAIVIFSGFGLVATALTILSDARAQYAKAGNTRPILVKQTSAVTRPRAVTQPRKIAA